MGMAADLKELGLLLVDNKRFAAQRTLTGRRLFSNLYKIVHFKTYRKRQALRAGVAPVVERFTIPDKDGFTLWRPTLFPALDEAIQEANDAFDRADLAAIIGAMPQQAPFTRVPFELRPDSAIARLATDPTLIRPFAEYLGVVPVLHTVQLMYSPNHRLVQGSSQFYHLDGQDVRSLQVFVYLHDVTEEHGPLTLLPAAASERIARTLRYRKAAGSRRIDDAVIARFAHVDRDVRVLTGRSGSLLVFDGDRCFHFGSRKATKPRRILHYAYVSPFAFTLPARWWERFGYLIGPTAPKWQRGVVARV